jgi:A/G-specific adenine glycosylase
VSDIAPLLLPWFEQHGRKNLPWQQQVSAYRVWLSEIMLQQTQVSTVIPYFERFITSFPDIRSLADAPLDEVLKHWAGLGYYARARNLHKAAKLVCDDFNAELPRDLEPLMAMPGVGRSTAGAILSLAYGDHAAILDGNVKRVLARVYQVGGWSGQASTLKRLWTLAEQQTPQLSVAYYNQAMMDLGAMICKRSRPGCECCPLPGICSSFKAQTQDHYPHPRPPKKRPHKHRWMLLHHQEERLLLERRPPQGIWGGLWSLPELQSLDELSDWQLSNMGMIHELEGCEENVLKHQFSHFDLSISIAHIRLESSVQAAQLFSIHDEEQMKWIDRAGLKDYGLPAPVFKLLTR